MPTRDFPSDSGIHLRKSFRFASVPEKTGNFVEGGCREKTGFLRSSVLSAY
jgi:hypothetical protein